MMLYLLCSEFARAFLHACDRIQARAAFDHFDGSGKWVWLHVPPHLNLYLSFVHVVMTISVEDRGRFFDALTALSAV